MHRATDKFCQAAALDFARRIVPFWQAALGSELLGAYLIGSLAHGGFSRRYSDVGMAFVTEAGCPRRRSITCEARRQRCQPIGDPSFSVFWTDRQFCLGRFPVLDRVDYIDHAVAIMERERVRPVRPTLEEI